MRDSVSVSEHARVEDPRQAFELAQAIGWELRSRLFALAERLVREPDLELTPAFNAATANDLLDRYRALSVLHPALSASQRERVIAQHRILVQPSFLSVPLIRRSIDRPLGYSGDYLMVEMIFGNSPPPNSRLAELLEQVVLAAAPSRAHRHRAVWAHGWLQTLERELGRPPRILSFACGPEIVLREHLRRGGSAAVVLCDQEVRALEHARAAILPWVESPTEVQAVQMNALNLLRGAGRSRLLQSGGEHGFDAVLVLGLFDYLRDAIVQRLMRAFHSLLRPCGLLLASNLALENPHRSLMEYVADWHVLHRERSDFERLMVAETGFTSAELTTDPTAANLLFAGRA